MKTDATRFLEPATRSTKLGLMRMETFHRPYRFDRVTVDTKEGPILSILGEVGSEYRSGPALGLMADAVAELIGRPGTFGLKSARFLGRQQVAVVDNRLDLILVPPKTNEVTMAEAVKDELTRTAESMRKTFGVKVRAVSRGDSESWTEGLVFAAGVGDVEAAVEYATDNLFAEHTGGPGQAYARRPIVRRSRGHVVVIHRGGLDI